jgi:replicative DNA helicase
MKTSKITKKDVIAKEDGEQVQEYEIKIFDVVETADGGTAQGLVQVMTFSIEDINKRKATLEQDKITIDTTLAELNAILAEVSKIA